MFVIPVRNPWFVRPTIVPLPIATSYGLWAAVASQRKIDVALVNVPGRAPWVEAIGGTDLFLCAALATSPAEDPADLSAWGFLFEHHRSLAPSAGPLRVSERSRIWDTRGKGLFAERIGMGMAAWLLWRHFGVVHLADAGPFIGRAETDPASPYFGKGLKSLGLYGKHGGYKPDFFCLTDTAEALIAESKGAIGPPSAISSKERAKAKLQVRNVDPVGITLRPTLNRLTFATTLRLADETPRQGTDSRITVEDPDGADDALKVPISPDEVVIQSYSKVLNLVGLGLVGIALRAGIRPLLEMPVDSDNVVELEGERIIRIGQVAGIDIGIQEDTAKAIFNESSEDIAGRVGRTLERSRLIRLAREGNAKHDSLVLPNGVIIGRFG